MPALSWKLFPFLWPHTSRIRETSRPPRTSHYCKPPWTHRGILMQAVQLHPRRHAHRCPQSQKVEPDRPLGPNLNSCFGFQVSLLRGFGSRNSIWGFSEALNRTPLFSTWKASLLELCQTPQFGKPCRVPEPPPHSKVSQATKPQ